MNIGNNLKVRWFLEPFAGFAATKTFKTKSFCEKISTLNIAIYVLLSLT